MGSAPRGNPVEGVVVAWLPHDTTPNEFGGHDPALFRFRHEDGDEEDLETAEVGPMFRAGRTITV